MSPTATFVLALIGVILATLSLIVASASLGWQVLNFLLTGPRPKVTIKLGVAGADGVPVLYWSPDNGQGKEDIEALGLPTREVFVVEVTNRGRSDIVLLTIGLSDTSFPWRTRYATVVSTGREPGSKLEGGAVRRWHADVWPLLNQLRNARPNATLRVRGCVRIGADRVVVSRGPRGLWKVPPDARTMFDKRLIKEHSGSATLRGVVRPGIATVESEHEVPNPPSTDK
ncbi:hypothetical protein Acsp06_54060 [Actinomycetospora sp. NBRC 106375]|uniref:hypothetical protein n=1 Tax=Actinomycetospora sp. NBRC 106375 TaxID=3032207 RepID=UPI0024A49113|nr:hypothetical protein [Actinomycetospora sp. NBRC 106375]GLZ49221.1 hypothetical protein Acsp06_54060 [Actinomycetospora sp. NBRC 106375]